jgi:hypothetical protein
MFDDSLKKMTTQIHATHKNQLILGMYNCPFTVVGYEILSLGQKFNEIASLINVNDPLIKAWLAIIAAAVAIIIPVIRNHWGINI